MPMKSDAARALAAYHIEPSLLDFDDRAAAQFVVNCFELNQIEQRSHDRDLRISEKVPTGKFMSPKILAEMRESRKWKEDMEDAFESFIVKHWQAIRTAAIELQNAGKQMSNHSIVRAANIPKERGRDELDAMLGDVRQ